MRPIAEPDEGRYAEAGRAMLESGDWLLPRQNGQIYPDKPAGIYWLMAPFLKLLGNSGFAARLPAVLAYLGLILLLVGWERRRGDASWGWTAAWIASACPLLAVLGQLATLDMVLTLCTCAGILVGWEWLQHGQRKHAWIAGAALGLGFFVKGPVAWLVPVAVLLVAALAARGAPRARRLASWHFWLPMVAIGLPWYVAAIVAEPELFDFWVKRETLQRVAGDVHGRGKPFWYMIAVAVGAWLPWLIGRFASKSRDERHPDEVLHIVWAFLPVLFFSLPAGKQPAYLAPAVPGFALWAARAWRLPRLRLPSLVLGSVLVAGFFVGLIVMLEPERARTEDPFADDLVAAGAEDWQGAQLNGWSYGFAYRLGRTDLVACSPNPRAWHYAETLKRVIIHHEKIDRYDCAADVLAGPHSAFVLLLDVDKHPEMLVFAEFIAHLNARRIDHWVWRTLGDRVLVVNRPPPASD